MLCSTADPWFRPYDWVKFSVEIDVENPNFQWLNFDILFKIKMTQRTFWFCKFAKKGQHEFFIVENNLNSRSKVKSNLYWLSVPKANTVRGFYLLSGLRNFNFMRNLWGHASWFYLSKFQVQYDNLMISPD